MRVRQRINKRISIILVLAYGVTKSSRDLLGVTFRRPIRLEVLSRGLQQFSI